MPRCGERRAPHPRAPCTPHAPHTCPRTNIPRRRPARAGQKRVATGEYGAAPAEMLDVTSEPSSCPRLGLMSGLCAMADGRWPMVAPGG
eukprot:4143834-Prymnesium_polylepis.1